MKGLGNYVCRRRLTSAIARGPWCAIPSSSASCAFADESPTGDRAELADLPDDATVWGEIAATPETRIGPRCAYFESCFVTGMRRRAAAAPLVIVNHHLFFADLALKARWPEAQVLPPYEVVIFDEAHQIEDVATEFFGVHASTQRLFALGRDLGRETGVDVARAQRASARLLSATGALADALRDLLPPPRAGVEEARLSFPIELATGAVLGRYHELDAALEQIADWLNPDGQAVASSRRPAEWQRSRGGPRRCAAIWRCWSRAAARARTLARRLAPRGRAARLPRRRRAAARARARRLPGPSSSPRRR